MSKAIIKKEIDKWLDDCPVAITLEKITEDKIEFTIGENDEKFSIKYPKDYPNSTEKFSISSEEKNLADWVQKVNEHAEKPKLKMTDLLEKAADLYLMDEDEEADEDEESNELEDDDLGLDTTEPEKMFKKVPKSKEEAEIEEKEFLPIGSPAATMRLIKDLKTLAKSNPKELGFSAAPIVHKNGLENLYHWHVKLFGFDKDSELYKDMEKFRKSTNHDHILIELRFSKDYPYAPPFVRVIRPRFAFRTGHVTIGGSICMELLTNSGWNSTNDIESILIQIRAEMTGGGARLDPGMSGNYEYSEHEAWDAFYRAARTHGWDVNGLSKDMFPKTD